MNERFGIVILRSAGFSLLSGGGGSASELRMGRRREANVESEIRQVGPTDATGVLMCRRVRRVRLRARRLLPELPRGTLVIPPLRGGVSRRRSIE